MKTTKQFSHASPAQPASQQGGRGEQSLLISLLRPILFVIMLLLCGLLSAQVDTTFFKVYHSTSQSWSGGVYGSGGGEKYTFAIIFKKDANIHIDTVWFYNKFDNMSCIKYKNTDCQTKVQKGDTAVYNSSVYYPGERDKIAYEAIDKKATVKNPFLDVPCDALIQFSVNGVKHYYPVKNIEELAPIAYP